VGILRRTFDASQSYANGEATGIDRYIDRYNRSDCYDHKESGAALQLHP